MSYRGYDELRRGLVGHWPLSEGVGTTIFDTSQYRNNGTLGAGAAAPTWVEGRNGLRALYFDGTDEVRIPHDVSLSVEQAGAISVIVWFTLTDPQIVGNGRIITKTYSDQYAIYQGSATKTVYVMVATKDIIVLNHADAFYDTFYCAGLVYDNGTVKGYLNGELKGSRDDVVAVAPNVDPVMIGRRKTPEEGLVGKVGEAFIIKRALDPIEMRNIYNLRELI